MPPPAARPIRVTFLPFDDVVTAGAGDTLLDAALDNGLDLPHECGGNCTCTTCHVVVLQGAESLSVVEPPENERLNDTPLRIQQSRLACQALLIGGDITVRIVGE